MVHKSVFSFPENAIIRFFCRPADSLDDSVSEPLLFKWTLKNKNPKTLIFLHTEKCLQIICVQKGINDN